MALFSIFVHTVAGRPVAKPAIRILVPGTREDVTSVAFGRSPVIGDAAGVYSYSFAGNTGPLLPRQYFVSIVAPGYEETVYVTGNDFTGIDTISANVVPVNYDEVGTIPPAPFRYVSPLFGVEIPITPVVLSAPFEYIQAVVVNEVGAESRIDVPVTGDAARLNLQARLRLAPTLTLVEDGLPAVTDNTFSGTFTTTVASVIDSGTIPRPGEIVVSAANIYPPGVDNDLSAYTNYNELATAQWITPWAELPKFLGHYADAMVWLPVLGEGDYALTTTYQDINRAFILAISTPLDAALFTPKKTVRVRIPEPESGAQYAQLVISQGGTPVTYPLIIRYING